MTQESRKFQVKLTANGQWQLIETVSTGPIVHSAYDSFEGAVEACNQITGNPVSIPVSVRDKAPV